MAKSTLEDVSLGDTIKHIKTFISPKLAKKLTFEDAESLSLLADNIQELLSTTLSKLVPNAVKNTKYSPSVYRSSPSYISSPPNTPVGIASINSEPKLIIAGDPLGGNFDSGMGSIGLFDVTEEVNKQVAESIQTEEPIEDEVEKLNSIFASVEDVKQE